MGRKRKEEEEVKVEKGTEKNKGKERERENTRRTGTTTITTMSEPPSMPKPVRGVKFIFVCLKTGPLFANSSLFRSADVAPVARLT